MNLDAVPTFKACLRTHYKLHEMSATFKALSTVEDFIHADDNVQRLDASRFNIRRSDLAEKPVIMVPKPS